MNSSAPKPLAATPNFIKSLLAGFDRISKHAWLVIFPVAVDLWLWWGPHLHIKTLLQAARQQLFNSSPLGTAQDGDLVRASQQVWETLAERFNVMIALRSYPVGIPSAMAGRKPIEIPFGMPQQWEITNIWMVIILWIAISLIGLVLGALFYQFLAPVALDEPLNLWATLAAWPKSALRVISVAVALVLAYLVITLPASCLLAVAWFSGLGQCIFFMYTGLLVWLLFPFFLSGHGIFVNGDGATVSIIRGARITRALAIPTSLLFMVILFLTQTLDLLWSATPDASWLTLLGVIGHAFVTTGLLAGTFVYYKEADQWVRSL